MHRLGNHARERRQYAVRPRRLPCRLPMTPDRYPWAPGAPRGPLIPQGEGFPFSFALPAPPSRGQGSEPATRGAVSHGFRIAVGGGGTRGWMASGAEGSSSAPRFLWTPDRGIMPRRGVDDDGEGSSSDMAIGHRAPCGTPWLRSDSRRNTATELSRKSRGKLGTWMRAAQRERQATSCLFDGREYTHAAHQDDRQYGVVGHASWRA